MMTLAQVVYQLSKDNDFASQLYADPETALEERGLKLSKEELAFLLSAPTRGEQDKTHLVSLANGGAAAWVI
jgi:hypothetical protein